MCESWRWTRQVGLLTMIGKLLLRSSNEDVFLQRKHGDLFYQYVNVKNDDVAAKKSKNFFLVS